MSRNTKIFGLFRRFLKEESGAAFPLIAMAFIGLVGSVGVAFDTARAQLVQVKLSSSLDAAGLAAAATISTVNLQPEVEKYLETNFPEEYMDATITQTNVAVNSDNTIITLSAEAEVPTTFMNLFGFDVVTVRADSEITRTNKGLELVMVLDNTGSMDGSKLSSLKTAAADLVNILYGAKNSIDNLWIGLVPFSQAVNIGTGHSTWMDTAYNSGLNWHGVAWAGCVDARLTGKDSTDDPPSTQLFRRYYWPDDSNNDWLTSGGSLRSGIGVDKGPNKNCPQPVTPMTANKSSILSAINSMDAVGNTHINLGAVWGWRMLSPRWRGLWGGEMDSNNLPLDYNTPLMNKAVVIMTDGDNTMSTSVRTAYWYPSDGRLGTTSTSTAETQLNNRLTSVCTAMKNNNILVYTVAFGSLNNSIKNLMRNCATQPDYFFASPTNADLRQAFRAIGDSLANLRVSK